MSGWDDYIKILMSSNECVKRGAIIGSADGALWACSPEFKASAEELSKLAQQFAEFKKIPETGVVLEGVKFIVPQAEESLLFGKKMKLGFFAGKSKSAIIIAIFEGDGTESGVATRGAVENLAKYLTDSNY